MMVSLQDAKNYFISTIICSIFLLFILPYSEAPLAVTCEAGGPYAKNATINIIGNVTNASTGGVTDVSVNISTGGSQKASENTSSDIDGRYHESISQNLDFDTYTVVVSAQNGSISAYCTDTVNIQIGVNTSCTTRTITLAGAALYSSNASAVTSGAATVGIAELNVANSSPMNSTGGFSVPITACLNKGTRYTFNVFVDDYNGRRSFLQESFVSP